MSLAMPRPRARRGLAAVLLLGSVGGACVASNPPPLPMPVADFEWQPQQSGTTASLRGLSAASAAVVWAGGTGGTFLRTADGGATWRADTVPGASSLDFRDVHAVDANTAYLMSAGEGEQSRIYKTTDGGRSWALQFTNRAPAGFFDGMAFWDSEHGIAYSDPVDGRFLVITTSDGGATWMPVPPENLPPALPGEAGFAASGTGIAVAGNDRAWFGTGGGSIARVFRSSDRGRTWTVAPVPLRSGGSSSGIFSLAFAEDGSGIAVGGDYTQPDSARANAAVTVDGGVIWSLVENSPPAGYRSAVAYVPGTASRVLVAVGTSGSDYSADGGRSWMAMDSVGYNSIAFAPSGDAGWAVGPEGRIAKLIVRRP